MKNLALLLLLVPTVALAGGRVSAFKPENKMGANYWAAPAAIDGKLETAWMVPGESENKGEWIEIDVPRAGVDKVAMLPGWAKGDEAFKDYPRVKKVRVDVFHLDDDQKATVVGSTTLDVADKKELQVFDIPDVKMGEGLFGGRVRFTVLEVYDGDDYPNLAVSEVRVMLAEFDAKAKITAIEGDAGTGPDLLTDEDLKTIWKTDAATAAMTIAPTGYGLSSIGFVGAGKDYARPKTVEITVGGLTETTVLPDAPGPQWAAAPSFNGYNGGAFGDLEVKIVDTYPGAKFGLGLAEVKMKATNLESF